LLAGLSGSPAADSAAFVLGGQYFCSNLLIGICRLKASGKLLYMPATIFCQEGCGVNGNLSVSVDRILPVIGNISNQHLI
jgi:hypothetical protein